MVRQNLSLPAPTGHLSWSVQGAATCTDVPIVIGLSSRVARMVTRRTGRSDGQPPEAVGYGRTHPQRAATPARTGSVQNLRPIALGAPGASVAVACGGLSHPDRSGGRKTTHRG